MMPSKVDNPIIVAKVRQMRDRGESIVAIARFLGISCPTIAKIIHKHGFRKKHVASTWRERRVTKRLALQDSAIAPSRHAQAWTPSEEAWLIEHAHATTLQEAAIRLGRSAEAVRKKSNMIGIKLIHSSGWLPHEDDYLRIHFDRKSINSMARHLDRGYHAVRKRMLALGLGTKFDQIEHRVTAHEIAIRLGVDVAAVRSWMRLGKFPVELIGKWLVTDDIAVTQWLSDGNILRADRSVLNYRDRTMYDRAVAEFYSVAYLRTLDVPALNAMGLYVRNEEGRRLHPHALQTGKGSSAEHTYYRKTDIWAWCYYVGHALPDHIADPDIADVQTAWLTEFVTTWELRKHFSSDQQNYWITHLGFPHSVIHSRTYRRAEVIAWLRERGKHDIAHKLTRGAVLCYDDLIRDRRSRSSGRAM